MSVTDRQLNCTDDNHTSVELTILLPSKGEGSNLEWLLPDLTGKVNGICRSSEIIVIDTMEPSDFTEAICLRSNVGYLKRGPTDDYGDAVRTGIAASKGHYVLVMDADGSHPPEVVLRLYARREEADVIVASRFLDTAASTDTPGRIFLSKLLNHLLRFLFPSPVQDLSGSFRLYRGALLRNLTLQARDFDIAEEIVFRLTFSKEQVRFLEIPFTHLKRVKGYSKRNYRLFLASMARTILRYRFGSDKQNDDSC